MNIILKLTEFINFFQQNLYFNIGIIVVIIGIFAFTFKALKDFYKLTAIGMAEMVKAQGNEILKGEEKFDQVFDKIEKTSVYKNTILKYITRDFLRKFLQFIYNKNKDVIKSNGTKQQ